MAEAAEEIVPEENNQPLIDDGTPETPTLPDPTEDREPGGSSPEDVFARKEYRTRKRVEEDLAREREERIRLEERLRAAEQAAKRPAGKEERIFTIAEVNAAVDAGTITRDVADRYIQEKIIPATVDERFRAKEQEIAQKAPLQRAAEAVNEYMSQIPELANKSSEEFRKVALEYSRLINEDGHSDDIRTQKLALQLTYGNLDQLKKRKEMAAVNSTPRTIPSDAGSGGGQRPTNGKLDVSKAPASMIERWDAEGVDSATRERRYRIYLDLKAAQRARNG